MPDAERGLDLLDTEWRAVAEHLLAVQPAAKRASALRKILKDHPDGAAMRAAVMAADPAADPLAPKPTERELPERLSARPWPEPMTPEAFYGPLGALVQAVAPLTEADPAAILVQLASASGSYVGPGAYAVIGTDHHPARLNSLVIGGTSVGRKGTSRGIAAQTLRVADEGFLRTNVRTGLSSGEGLLWEVRDPIHQNGQLTDQGVDDKRRWIVEPEFASVLRVAQRTGSTLSTMLRAAWDGGILATMTKSSPAIATGAHIVVTGHATPHEFIQYLDQGELAGGTVNRFLLVASRRPHLRPDGDAIPDAVFVPFAEALIAARQWADERPRLLKRDQEANARWHAVYEGLTAERPGLFGAAVARASAQVMRLAVLYAALDRSEVIRVEHLNAALAVWMYVEDTARWLFGDSTGNRKADQILGLLRNTGEADRTAIHALFGNNLSRDEIDKALDLLLDAGLATSRKVKTGGRDRVVWSAPRAWSSVRSNERDEPTKEEG